MNKIKVGIIGVGGFGRDHQNSISDCQKLGVVKLEAAVIRNMEKGNYKEVAEKLEKNGVRIYKDWKEMLKKEKGNLDLIAIPTGIAQHEPMSVAAMKSGYHVFCEKPAAGTYKECLNMEAVAKETGKILAIGYQNIYSNSIQKIKEIALSKKLGKLLYAKTYAIWPRSSAYYKRNDWAGRLEVNGKKIYDSPMMNATAHFLQNMLYVAGTKPNDSATPISVYGEAYRVKEITSADTQYIRVKTKNGVELQFIVTHAASAGEGPYCTYVFENGKIEWGMGGDTKVYEGTKKLKEIDSFSNEGETIHSKGFYNTAMAILNNKKPLCTIDNSKQHVLCINKLFESSGEIHQPDSKFTDSLPVEKEAYDPTLDVSKESHIIIKGIEEVVKQSHAERKSPFELGVPWAKSGKELAIK